MSETQTELQSGGQAADYDAVLTEVAALLEAARRTAARSVNAVMTATYWQIGRRLVEVEQQGQDRAEYGERLVERLSQDLTARFGRGFGRRNLFQMRAFYVAYASKVQTVPAQLNAPIPQTVSAESTTPIIQPVSGQFDVLALPDPAQLEAELSRTRLLLEGRQSNNAARVS
jgi:hypothetical protein